MEREEWGGMEREEWGGMEREEWGGMEREEWGGMEREEWGGMEREEWAVVFLGMGCLGGAKLNIVILWGGKAIKAHNGVLGYTLPGFLGNLGALRSHLVPSGCPQGHLWACLIRYYFWSFILIYGDRDGNLSMLKGRLQVLKQVPCDPPRKFFIIGVPRLHLVQFKHNNFL